MNNDEAADWCRRTERPIIPCPPELEKYGKIPVLNPRPAEDPADPPSNVSEPAPPVGLADQGESLARMWKALWKKGADRQPRKLLQATWLGKHFDERSAGNRTGLSFAAYGEPYRMDRELTLLKTSGYIESKRGVGTWLTDLGRKLAEAEGKAGEGNRTLV